MIWILLSMLCSFACVIGLAFSGVIYEFRVSINRARRLELGGRGKVIALVPEEFRPQSKHDHMVYVSCFLVLSVLLLVLQFRCPELVQSYGNASGLLLAGLVGLQFARQWARGFRRSRAKVANLGKNPFDLRPSQRWCLFGHYFFLWLTMEMSLLYFGQFPTAACGLPLLVAFLIFATAARSEMTWHENGIFLGTRFYSWNEITWYRWYQNRCGIVFGHNRWQFPCPVHYLPAEDIGSDRLAALLEQYLPGKERETVEDYLMSCQAQSQTRHPLSDVEN